MYALLRIKKGQQCNVTHIKKLCRLAYEKIWVIATVGYSDDWFTLICYVLEFYF